MQELSSTPPTAAPQSASSPPAMPVERAPETDEPRARLRLLAEQLARAKNRAVLQEYLRLRRIVRSI